MKFVYSLTTACLFSSLFLSVCSVQAQTGGVTPATGAPRVCSARPAAVLFAKALADKVKKSFDATASANKATTASVRVLFSPARTAPTKVSVDFAKDVAVSFNLSATGDKISFQGVPSAATLYQSCDPGKITFTVIVSYRDTSKTPQQKVDIRQSVDVTLPGQLL
jgi:hypothetical protein